MCAIVCNCVNSIIRLDDALELVEYLVMSFHSDLVSTDEVFHISAH